MDNSSIVLLALGLAVAVNFMLTLAAIRKLRELEDQPATPRADFGLPVVGTPVGQFATHDLAGAALSNRDLEQGTVRIVFLLPGCKPCEQLKAALRVMPASDVPLLAIVSADRGSAEAAEIMADLPEHARAIVGKETAQEIGTALSVSTYPAVLTIVDGVVVHASIQALAHGRQIAAVAG